MDASVHAPSGATVLVVDDSEAARSILVAILASAGLRAVEAADGEEALAALDRCRPDLILLDALMPGLSGYEVCEELQRRSDPTPVIFLSALSDPADRVAGLERGAVDFVSKPFDPLEVRTRVTTQLRLRRLATELEETNRRLRERESRLAEDLRTAAEVQRALLPGNDEEPPGLRAAWRFAPCQELGGDLLRLHRRGNGAAAWILDVAGHGAAAALLASAVWQALSPTGRAMTGPSPSDVLARLDALFPIERFERHFTLAVVFYDDETGELRSSSGGHPPPMLLRRASAEVVELRGGGPLLGLGAGIPFEESVVRLHDGDRVLLLTDGLLEAEGRDGEPLGSTRVADLLRRTRDLPLETACDAMLAALEDRLDGEAAIDDVTLLLLEKDPRSKSRPDALSLRVDGRLEDLRFAAMALAHWAAEAGLGEEESGILETAAVEAMNNAVIHGGATDVTLAAKLECDSVLVEVGGDGPPFEPPATRVHEGEPVEGGRGWSILRACMDEASVRREGGRNVVVLRRRLGAGRTARTGGTA